MKKICITLFMAAALISLSTYAQNSKKEKEAAPEAKTEQQVEEKAGEGKTCCAGKAGEKGKACDKKKSCDKEKSCPEKESKEKTKFCGKKK